ncbi:MAG: nucleotidyltransferase family protein [Candidatus Heimdallarchaeota archaeon]
MREVVLLCGGKDDNFPEDKPKALLPIGSKTLLEHQIEYLKKQGTNRIILATDYLSEQIELLANELSGDYDIPLLISRTHNLGTGGSVREAIKYLTSDAFWLKNVDDLTDIDFDKMLSSVTPSCRNVIAISNFSLKFGIVHVHEGWCMGFTEKPYIKDMWAYCGTAYLTVKDVIDKLPEVGSIERDTFPNMPIRIYKYKGNWVPLNEMKDLKNVVPISKEAEK